MLDDCNITNPVELAEMHKPNLNLKRKHHPELAVRRVEQLRT
jgi:hypothetical protein